MLFCDVLVCFFFFKQKTAYEMRISDWSSDVCSSDLEKLAVKFIGHRGVEGIGEAAAIFDDRDRRPDRIDRLIEVRRGDVRFPELRRGRLDRKSTRLNSSH